MADIGGITCTFVKGDSSDPKQRVGVWQLPGVDGFGAQTLGGGESRFVFAAVKYGSSSAVDNWVTQLEALQGTVVTIVNDWGVTFTNMLVTRVGFPAKTAELGNGGARCQVTVRGVVV